MMDTRMQADGNLAKYESGEVVSYYERQTQLQPAEAHLFSRHLRPDMAILDIGVGGGRTTPYLAKGAARYVGADYSNAMVESCRARFPKLEFRHCDATDMSQFQDGEFDAVVFSFNGIDIIRTDEGRKRCLEETARVLKSGGVFIFSSHNARILGVWPELHGARPHQVAWRIVRAVGKTAQFTLKALRDQVFSAGQGYIHDPVHGGMDHYVSTPETMAPQLRQAGLDILEQVAGPSPDVRSPYFVPWHYYACRKVHPS
jgi:ubiquinone/menaquinone biosynthesis C-methylase UbiE